MGQSLTGYSDPSLRSGLQKKVRSDDRGKLLLLRHNLQPIAGQDLLDLIFGVDGPGAHSIQPCVSFPMMQSLAGLTGFFKGKREIVMSVGVSGCKGNCRL